MFTCKKCNKPFHVKYADIRGSKLRMRVQCLNGHREDRKVPLKQANDMLEDLYQGLSICLNCGRTMGLLSTDLGKRQVMFIFVCPEHGPQERPIPVGHHPAISALIDIEKIGKSVETGFKCPRCGEEFIVHEIGDKRGVLQIKSKCPNGHKEMRYLPRNSDVSILKGVMQRVLMCDECGLSCSLEKAEVKGRDTRVELSCPVHGKSKKRIPAENAELLREVSGEAEKDAIVKDALTCRDCGQPLSIRSIDTDKKGYKIKCRCSKGHSCEIVQPIERTTQSIDAIVNAVLKCDKCDLLTHILEKDVNGENVTLELVCPIHGTMRKALKVGVYKQIEEREPAVDRRGSLDESFRCSKCNAPFTIRNIKIGKGLFELQVKCQNGHGSERVYAQCMNHEFLVKLYGRLYECPKCHDKLSLVEIKPREREGESLAVLTCSEHGDTEMPIPTANEAAVRDAYLATADMAYLDRLIDEKLQAKREFSVTLDAEADADKVFGLVEKVIEQHDVWFVGERGFSEVLKEALYYGKATAEGAEVVIIGSVSRDARKVTISVASEDEAKFSSLLGDMRENLRDLLLRSKAVAEPVQPRRIECSHCGGALLKRALPGETTICPHCASPLHWD